MNEGEERTRRTESVEKLRTWRVGSEANVGRTDKRRRARNRGNREESGNREKGLTEECREEQTKRRSKRE